MGGVKKKVSDSGMQRVSGEELREYLKLPVDQELSKPGVEVRILTDGRVLWKLVTARSGTTWPSREAYTEAQRRFAEEAAKARSAPHPAVALLPPIDDFLRDVEVHAKSLGPRLHIPDEALDGTVASLGAVDKALKRIPRAERPVADLVTPLVAYVGEVMRKASGGQWIKVPPTYTVRMPVFDPAELAAWQEAQAVGQRAFRAAQQGRRGASSPEAFEASRKALEATGVRQPKPIRYDTVEKPRGDSGNAPVVVASNGQSFEPFSDLFIWMVEPSKRNPPHATVEARLHGAGYPTAPTPPA
jgi:hypothetical protein